MSLSPNSTFSLNNSAEKIVTNNMAGVVNGGMNNSNITNNYFINIHPEMQSEAKVEGELGNINKSTPDGDLGTKFGRPRRMSETEVSLVTRREVAGIKSTVTEETDYEKSRYEQAVVTRREVDGIKSTVTEETDYEKSRYEQAVQPKKDTQVEVNEESYPSFDVGVDDDESRLKRKMKVEKAVHPTETDPPIETSQSTATCCSSSVLVVGCPAMAIPHYYNIPSSYIFGLTSKEHESNFENQSYNNVILICPRSGESEAKDVDKTTSTPVCSPSVELNPEINSSKKEPGNTVAEEPKDGQLFAGGESLTCFSSVCEELAKMNDKRRFMVEDIFKQLVTRAENHPTSTMKNISSYICACLLSNHPEEDWGESVHDNFTSLTDFKELEKKLRTLDDRILNFDFPRVLYIARFRPQMLVKILEHLHSPHAVGVEVDDGWGTGTWLTFILSNCVMLIMGIVLMAMIDGKWLMKHE